MFRLLVVNGPNLDRLGKRQPKIYGALTLAELNSMLAQLGRELNAEVEILTTNDEGAIIARLGRTDFDGLAINPGGLTHYSRSLGDAVAALPKPVVEVHVSNIFEREPFRRRSTLDPSYRIYGRGIEGYSWAIRYLANRLLWETEPFKYGPFRDQIGEFRRPSGQTQSLIVLIHGGLWLHQWTADTTEGLAIDLSRRGFLTLNLEYRRLGLGGGWPETFDDLSRALSRLHEETGFAAENMALLGHSAGATMALWAASFHPGPVVALAPTPDLVRAVADPTWAGPVRRLFDGDLPPPDTYSPRHRPPPLGPALVVAARQDTVSPLAPIDEYVSAHKGIDFEICDGDHWSLLEPSSTAWRLVCEWLGPRKVTL